MSGKKIIVVDNGSGMCKAGFGGDDAPKSVFDSVVGRSAGNPNEAFVADEALAKRDSLELKHPIERGLVTNWDDMEKIWHYTFYNELKVDPKECSLLLTEPIFNPKATRERMTKIMFETFNVPHMYVCLQAMLALYATGKSTGLVIDSGYDVTQVVPIYQGYSLPASTQRLLYAGEELTQYLGKLLAERGYSFSTAEEKQGLNDIKEKFCYVAEDFAAELKKADKSIEKTYKLASGKEITIGNERFRCPEALFQSSLVGKEGDGLEQAVVASVLTSDAGQKAEILSHIIFSGGSTRFPGIADRLTKALTNHFRASQCTVVAPSEEKYATWRGGSKLATLPTFDQMSISRKEYDEIGPNIVNRKCMT